jgi:hypothetical protein
MRGMAAAASATENAEVSPMVPTSFSYPNPSVHKA